MPVVNPGIRRFLGSAIQRLFNSASFYAPLTHSLVPERGTGSPTFTRATAKTWQNNDGYLVRGVAGEIGFVGARRVRNLAKNTENITAGGGWTLQNCTSVIGATDPNGGSTAFTLTGAVGGAINIFIGNTGVATVGNQPLQSWWLRRVTGTGNVSMIDGNGNIDGTALAVTSTWARFSDLNAVFSASTAYVGLHLQTVGDVIEIWHPQLEDVTAQTTQTAGEYVSVGVPSDWAGTELVTNGTFDTDTTGWTAGTGNSLAWQNGAAKCTRADAGDKAFFGHGFSVIAGAKYVISAEVLSDGTSTTARAYLGTVIGAGDIVTGPAAAFGQVVFEYTAGVTGTIYIWFYGTSTAAGNYIVIDNVSIKPAYYHGSGVDGVKCFPTDLSGNPIPSTTLLGYSAEGARTNPCLQSNAFTTTWVAIGTPAATQNVVGPDGSTSAWTLTDDSAVANEGVQQNITPTAADHTFSVFVKKTTGAQASYPIIDVTRAGTHIAAATIDTTNGTATVWTAYTGLTIIASSARCESFNANFWRVSLTYLGTAVAHTHNILAAATTNPTQSTGTVDVTAQGSAVFYGAQVELGSFASSYIATTTIAVARNADVLKYSSAGNISDTAGWCYAEASTLQATASQSAIVTSGGGVGLLELLSAATTISTDDGALGVTKTGLASMQNVTQKVASSWGAGGQFVTGGGASPASGAYDGSHGTTAIGIGGGASGEIPWYGNIKNVRIGQRQLSASELQSITA